jgi:hypothetical protein
MITLWDKLNLKEDQEIVVINAGQRPTTERLEPGVSHIGGKLISKAVVVSGSPTLPLITRKFALQSHAAVGALSPCASVTELSNGHFAEISSLRLLTGSGGRY